MGEYAREPLEIEAINIFSTPNSLKKCREAGVIVHKVECLPCMWLTHVEHQMVPLTPRGVIP